MKTLQFALVLGIFSLLSACGGPGENATVPAAQPAGATNEQIGDHVVHFSAQNTDQLSAEIAKAYDIVRSKNRAMLNVSVVHADGSGSVPAEVSVKTVNLTGQSKSIAMRQIDDQDAVYYIGVSTVANQETLIFDISVKPEGSDTSHSVRFQRKFYTD